MNLERPTKERIEELRKEDRLIYYLPMEGEDSWWMSTHTVVDHIGGTVASAHRRLIKYRNEGVVEQLREDSPKRPGRTRYLLDHTGAKWRLRQPKAEQEDQQELGLSLSTEGWMVLNVLSHEWVQAMVQAVIGLRRDEVDAAVKEINRALGREA